MGLGWLPRFLISCLCTPLFYTDKIHNLASGNSYEGFEGGVSLPLAYRGAGRDGPFTKDGLHGPFSGSSSGQYTCLKWFQEAFFGSGFWTIVVLCVLVFLYLSLNFYFLLNLLFGSGHSEGVSPNIRADIRVRKPTWLWGWRHCFQAVTNIEDINQEGSR